MPIEPRDPAGSMIGRKSRFVRVSVRVNRSGPFDLRNATLATRTLGTPPAPPLDVVPPPPPEPATGEFAVEGLLGWHPRQSIEITQPATRPAPLTVQALAMTVAVGG